MRLYLGEYDYRGSQWGGIEIWARDRAEAERKLQALQATARIIGEQVASVKTPNWIGRIIAWLLGGRAP